METINEKRKWPLEAASIVALDLGLRLSSSCEQIAIAGSIRRRKPLVGDVEIIYVSKIAKIRDPGDLFGLTQQILEAEIAIERLEHDGIIEKRILPKGRTAYGSMNKLMVHVPSGIPVDLFRTTQQAWWNYLVCRTGPSASNIRISQAAIARGMSWTSNSAGFRKGSECIAVYSEQEVFETVGLPFLPPHER
jgi:DNA polymerase (family 10)